MKNATPFNQVLDISNVGDYITPDNAALICEVTGYYDPLTAFKQDDIKLEVHIDGLGVIKKARVKL